MEKQSSFFFFLLFLTLLPSICICDQRTKSLQTYIIHVQPIFQDSNSFLTSEDHERWHKSFLPVESRLIYSYHHAISGFSARLTEEELKVIEKKPEFLHAYPDKIVPVLTTHTPEFLGLSRHDKGLWKDSEFGRGVIVGVLDTGISPDHPSFREDKAIPPPPPKWKGGCDFGGSLCNNKLIGARNFVRGISAMQGGSDMSLTSLQTPPNDTDGHGTHTASTAAGMFVRNANIEGQVKGTAAGMAPYAHLAIYKVCSHDNCTHSDILAGMDSAIYDGVDVMSLSIGTIPSFPYYDDTMAIGAFAAMARGIFVSCAGGNAGPGPATLINEAPWILTVGASTMDRNIRTTVKLGNGKECNGESLHQPKGYPSPSLPLVFPGSSSSPAAACSPGSLAGINVTGKIVVCNDELLAWHEKGIVVKNAGGAGMIITNAEFKGFNTFPEAHVLPVSDVSYSDGMKIKSYINSTTPTASILFKGTITGSSVVAPTVTYFSSRGPNRADPKILKPDIIGPGVNVLAAWPFNVGNPGTRYNILSGTSMSTPHLSGIAALLKNTRPDWSPAAIKSAIMTTAYTVTNNGKPIPDQNLDLADFFATGAGHVDPLAANNPGLIYDISPEDYIAYLCGMPYTDAQVSVVVRRRINCSDFSPISGTDLNYPSFMVSLKDGESMKVTRTVTNVGSADSTYKVVVVNPIRASVTVEPETLRFTKVNKKAKFTVTFTGKGCGSGSGVEYSAGYLTWVSSSYRVKSPIMIAVGGSRGPSI